MTSVFWASFLSIFVYNLLLLLKISSQELLLYFYKPYYSEVVSFSFFRTSPFFCFMSFLTSPPFFIEPQSVSFLLLASVFVWYKLSYAAKGVAKNQNHWTVLWLLLLTGFSSAYFHFFPSFPPSFLSQHNLFKNYTIFIQANIYLQFKQ